jgi:predicted MPP superfamily phosphohydrolase
VLLIPGGPNYIGDLIALCLVFMVQAVCAWMLWRDPERSPRFHRAIPWALCLSMGAITLGVLMRFHRVNRFFPVWFRGWGRGTAITWAFLSVLLAGAWVVSRVLRVRSHHSPARRAFLRTAQAVVFGVPAIVTGYGVFIGRFRISVREQDIAIPGLPADLNGLRLAQLTDIHLSPFLSAKELARAVDLANETRPHLTLVTGDLITSAGDPLDACLAQLARLRADAGLFGCNGNHEIYTGTERYVEKMGARQGLHILRSRNAQLRFGSATLNLAGVDYQRSRHPYLPGAERLVEPGAVNILLSHNPDVFPVAAAQGYDLTISGHTHGGQVRVEILHQDLNVARFFTPYVDGLYRLRHGDRDASIFVSRGIGTIALPARIGAPPEVALLKLCRS